MNWHILSLSAIFHVFIPTAVLAQESNHDTLSISILSQLKSKANDNKRAVQFYKEHLLNVRYDGTLFEKAVHHFYSNNLIETAKEILKTNPFLVEQHNERALYFYYLSIAQMLDKRGWPNFKQAEKSLNRANVELRRSMSPDYGFFSDVENARGYLSLVARGESTNEDRGRVCIIRTEFIYRAIHHFREALIYNPDNAIAQRNLDTLILKLHKAGIPIPPDKYEQNIVLNQAISLDSINVDSINDISSIPVLDYSLLPKNHELILRELHAYDEIILLIDLSGSMDDPVEWSDETSKFHIAQQLALFIALKLRANVFLGAISVGRGCDMTSMVLNYPIASVSRKELTMKIVAIRPSGHTPLDQRLRLTKDMFSSKRNKKLVFLLSDGMDTCGDIPDLCGTAAMLAAHGIDLFVFSFILEGLDPESRSAYSIYNCMVNPSQGKIYKITQEGDVDDEIEYIPVSNNILVLPPMDTSALWRNNPGLYQFDIENVEPGVEKIIKLHD